MKKNILSEIFERKKESLVRLKKQLPLSELAAQCVSLPARKDFAGAVSGTDAVNIIAEIKRASPSAGDISLHVDPVRVAAEYEHAGAAAVSVLTEEHYFKGDLSFLKAVRDKVSLPLLRKDFILDEYQVYEAALYGADAVLLIATYLDSSLLARLLATARSLKLACLVEVHTTEDLSKALQCGAAIIGVNNRSLIDFSVDLNTGLALSRALPAGTTAVIESGIASRNDIRRFLEQGVHSFLIGETLMRSADRRSKLRELKGEQDDKS